MRWKNIRNFSLMVDQMCKLVANAFDIFYSFVLAEWTDLRGAAVRWRRSAKAGSIIRPGFALFSIRGIRVLYVWWPLCVSGTSYHRSRQPKLMYGMWNCGCSPAFFIYFLLLEGGWGMECAEPNVLQIVPGCYENVFTFVPCVLNDFQFDLFMDWKSCFAEFLSINFFFFIRPTGFADGVFSRCGPFVSVVCFFEK